MKSLPTISRRKLLASTGIASIAAAIEAIPARAATAAPKKQATFVLVHGAFHGGWCWKKLTPLLRAAGHEVFTPTLTGLGERSHLLSPAIDLETHVKDIAAVLEYEDLQEVVLLGHSYGGMVITGVADKLGTRLAQLIYLDALIPESGEAVKDYTPRLIPEGTWRIPPPGSPQLWGVTDAHDIAWLQPRLADQPLKTFTQPLQLSAKTNPPVRSAFIQCSVVPKGSVYAEHIERARRQGFQYRALLSAGHDAMVTQPRELAKILFELI